MDDLLDFQSEVRPSEVVPGQTLQDQNASAAAGVASGVGIVHAPSVHNAPLAGLSQEPMKQAEANSGTEHFADFDFDNFQSAAPVSTGQSLVEPSSSLAQGSVSLVVAPTMNPLLAPASTSTAVSDIFAQSPAAVPSTVLPSVALPMAAPTSAIASVTHAAPTAVVSAPHLAESRAPEDMTTQPLRNDQGTNVNHTQEDCLLDDLVSAPGQSQQHGPMGVAGDLLCLGSEFDPMAQTMAEDQLPLPAAAPVAAQGPTLDVAPAAVERGNDGGDLLDSFLDGKSAAPAEETPGADTDLEDVSKKIVYVYHKGERNVLGWYTDASKSDIKEAVMCACDALMDQAGQDGGFVLREVHVSAEGEDSSEVSEGRIFTCNEFHELGHEHTYVMEEAEKTEELKKLTGDRWRRLKVQVEPLLHVEAQKAVERMRRGSNLLKHTSYGIPHLRQFQLSDDRKRLIWYSGAKRKSDSIVNLEEVQEIRLGQTTPTFMHYRLPMLEHLSFSLVYGRGGAKSLDLTCKDEFEFDHWVTGLKAVFYHLRNRQISKTELLGHSKRFVKALEKNNVGIKLTKLPEVKEKGHVGLDDCIQIVTHSTQELEIKLDRLRERLKVVSQQVAGLDAHADAEMEVDFSMLTGQGPAYANVFDQDEDAQDDEMEIRRMHELVEATTLILQEARTALSAAAGGRPEAGEPSAGAAGSVDARPDEVQAPGAACRHVDQLLWKAEVDLENVEDMFMRHQETQSAAVPILGFNAADVAEMNAQISQSLSDVGAAIDRKFEDMRSWFR